MYSPAGERIAAAPPVHTTGAKRLIVSADDLGLSPGVNAGIIAAHRDGILTDASLMVNGTACDDAIDLARRTPTLSVGLHLVLAHGHATLSPDAIPGLVDSNGMFHTNAPAAGFRYFFTPGLRAELAREVQAQLDKFQRSGLPLSHVDGHLNIHMHPTVLGILLHLAPRYGIGAIRLPREPWRTSLRLDRRDLRRKLVEAMIFRTLTRYARRRLAAHGVRHPDQMFGLHQSGHVTEAYLLGVLTSLPAGVTEIYSHPSILDAEARRWRPADYESDLELAALTSPRVRHAIEAAGIESISYRQLTSSG